MTQDAAPSMLEKASPPALNGSLLRELGPADGLALVVGTVIGSGIFLVPASVARQLTSVLAALSVWAAGGLLSLFGALSIAELASIYPGAGGLYVYLHRVYGPAMAFVYGWALLAMIHTGSLATLAVAFGLYTARVLGLSATVEKLVAISCIVLLTAMNCFGVRSGKLTQNIVTVCKLAGIASLILLLGRRGHLSTLQFHLLSDQPVHYLRYGAALVAVLWAYEGWHCVSFAAGEFRDAKRDLPRALGWGTFVIVMVYLLANIAYYLVLTPEQLQTSDRAAAVAVNAVYGWSATVYISALILVSILGATNGMILTGARVYYAMARDRLFFRIFGHLHSRYRTPVLALVLQAAWASVLALAGSFQELFTYVVFTGWIFYGVAVAAVIVQRRRRPDVVAPFRVPGYPAVPILFVIAAFGIAVSTILNSPAHAAIGLALVALSLPLYIIFFRASSHATSSAVPSASAE